MSFDSLLHQYYDNVEEVWSRPSEAMSHVTLVSVSGGERDVMVPSHLSIVPGAINLAVSQCHTRPSVVVTSQCLPHPIVT